ncbi:MAG: asparagine--tRNA ligase [Simkaniaceae bacterium]
MKRIKIKHLDSCEDQIVTISGWVKSKRAQKTFAFLEVNDGSTFNNFQAVLNHDLQNYDTLLNQISTGASLSITGKIVKSMGGKQAFEMQAESVKILGECPPDEYPLQKKRHSFEFLRSIAHLRPRTNTQGAVARVRSQLAFATHTFFQNLDFLYLQSPIITGSDCEGAGNLFQVTTLDFDAPPLTPEKKIDFSKDFFGQTAFLTVSGQLNGEVYASALSDIYTFGPTFRAENSHTQRHLAEFWMIEPEMAFADLNDNCDMSEKFLKFLIKHTLENSKEDLQFFDQFIEKGLLKRLHHVLDTPFARMSYTEAIETLIRSNKKFEFKPEWGIDLQTEHERYLSEEYCKKPLIVTDYPKEIKAFYMRSNEDGKTVAAMDVLVPKIGEIIGGSQREERYDYLDKKFTEHHLNRDLYGWYLDLRKYGSVPHAGFGAGFERLVQFVTGMENIRDVIAFPRVPGQVQF